MTTRARRPTRRLTSWVIASTLVFADLGASVAAPTGSATGGAASRTTGSAVSKAETHTVTIDATRYQPSMLVVRPGDSIVWVNNDLFRHTVTSPAGFDSKDIAPGASWTYTPKAKGRVEYACVYHTTMVGTLIVR